MITGSTPEEMMANGEKHIRANADEGHLKAVAMMEESANNPEMMKVWMDKFMADYAALPEM